VTSSEQSDDTLAETAAGAVQGGGAQDATGRPEPDVADDEQGAGESDAAGFAVDREADPPKDVQPTTS
jgi:hypothetical protein